MLHSPPTCRDLLLHTARLCQAGPAESMLCLFKKHKQFPGPSGLGKTKVAKQPRGDKDRSV